MLTNLNEKLKETFPELHLAILGFVPMSKQNVIKCDASEKKNMLSCYKCFFLSRFRANLADIHENIQNGLK